MILGINAENQVKIKHYLINILIFLLSFGLPFALCMILFATNNFYPFKEDGQTIIMMDMQSEYIAYFRYLKSILSGDGNLFYTLGKVFGGDFLSIYSFYLASPLNFFVVFSPYESIPAFLFYICIIKISLSGLTMYTLLRQTFKKDRFIYLLFAVAYALCSYSFVYMSNLMWLDGVMILPLVILGLNYLFNYRHYWIYFISLAFALMTSWYIGAMICIFSVLYFFFLCLSKHGENISKAKETHSRKIRLEFWKRFLHFAISSLLAGLLSAFIWVGSFYHLMGTKATNPDYFTNNWFNSFASIFTGFFEDNYYTNGVITQYTGYAPIFVSIVVLVFFILFFFNKKINIWQRLGILGVFIFYLFGIYFNGLNLVLHGGKLPTWFPTRYSFIISFIIVYFGAKECEKLDDTSMPALLAPIGVMIVVLSIVLTIPDQLSIKTETFYVYKISFVSLFIFLITIFIIFIYLLFKKYKPKYSGMAMIISSILLLILGSYSSYRGANNVLEVNAEKNQYQSYAIYAKDNSYQSDFDNIKSYDENGYVYRMENTFLRPGSYNETDNDPMFYNFNGFSHYSSSEKKVVEDYFKKLGFQYNGFFEKYDGGSTVAMNSYLGIKYLIDDTNKLSNKPVFQNNYPFEELTSIQSINDGIKYFENTFALPLGFVSDQTQSYYINEGVTEEGHSTVRWFDDFEYQNQVFKSLNKSVYTLDGDGEKVQKNIFNKIEINDSDITCLNASYVKDEYGYRKFTSTSDFGYVKMKFTVPDEAFENNLYVSFKDATNYGKAYFYLDGKLTEINNYWHNGIRGFVDNSSHKHEISFYFNEPLNDAYLRDEVYYEDLDVLYEYIQNILTQSSKNLTETKGFGTYGLQGTFNYSSEGEDKIFLFTLPYEQEMAIYVDGIKQKVIQKFNIFTLLLASRLAY